MITYEANLNCDGQNCKTYPITNPITNYHEPPCQAKILAKQRARFQGWVFIDGEHYCPDCAEVTKPVNGNHLIKAIRESIKKEEARY